MADQDNAMIPTDEIHAIHAAIENGKPVPLKFVCGGDGGAYLPRLDMNRWKIIADKDPQLAAKIMLDIARTASQLEEELWQKCCQELEHG